MHASANARRDFWEAAWSGGNADPSTSYAPLLIRSYDMGDKDVLEIGCGNLLFNSSDAKLSRSYVGIDLAVAPLREARMENPSLPLAAADAFLLPFRDGSFDAVTSVFVFPLLGEGITDALAESRRVLRTGGTLTFNIVHTDIMAYHREKAGCGGRTRSGSGTLFPRHERLVELISYDREGIEEQLRESGFDIGEIRVFKDYDFSVLGIEEFRRRPRGRSETDDIDAEILVTALRR